MFYSHYARDLAVMTRKAASAEQPKLIVGRNAIVYTDITRADAARLLRIMRSDKRSTIVRSGFSC